MGLRAFLLFLALTPIFFCSVQNNGNATLRIAQEQMFQIGTTVLYAIVILDNIYLAGLLIWAVFVYGYYQFPQIGGNYVINILWGCILYQVAYQLANEENIKKIFNVILGVCAFNILWVALQKADFDFIFFNLNSGLPQNDLVGLMGLKAFMGCLFAMFIPVLASVNVWLTPAFFLPIYLSESSVAMVGGIAGLLFHLWHNSKKAFSILIVILTVGGGLYVQRDTHANMFTDRFGVWKVSLRDAVKHPIVGYGLDSFRNVGLVKPFLYFKNYRTNKSEAFQFHPETQSFVSPKNFSLPTDACDPWDNPHNEFVSIIYEAGLVAMAIICFFMWDIKRRFSGTPNEVAIMGFFISLFIICTGQFPLHVTRLGVFVPVMLGVYYRITDERQRGVLINGS